ncbi:hypothetical protein CKO31_11020 [Thiohalocapsa halophila]|uniref:Uncharacterized protein n=1 Tax=Thiohalocapsa halophila TaxID=69359 RepID=A0ABS1CH65_9GAMM|nr:hypothetical protein [Thiohalocapsa halophila]
MAVASGPNVGSTEYVLLSGGDGVLDETEFWTGEDSVYFSIPADTPYGNFRVELGKGRYRLASRWFGGSVTFAYYPLANGSNGVDQYARDRAQFAMDAANAAQACCEANEERINRMFAR